MTIEALQQKVSVESMGGLQRMRHDALEVKRKSRYDTSEQDMIIDIINHEIRSRNGA